MGSLTVMTEPTPIMLGGPSGCSSSSLAPGVEVLVAPTTARGEDGESLWESDWDSDCLWESDWESGGEEDAAIVKQKNEDHLGLQITRLRPRDLAIVRQKNEDGDLEPTIKRLRPRNPAVARQKNEDDDSEHKSKRLKSKGPDIVKQKNEDDDAEPKVMRLKSIKTLTGDDRPTDDDDDQEEEEEDNNEDEEEEEDDDSDDSDSEKGDAHIPGLACHYCKYRNAKRKVHCSRCPIRFCGLCLRNRNGEQLEVETQKSVKWVCPRCRAGCGPGCNNCCTCAPCRKSQGLPSTGQTLRIARQAGFDNVHDYLIHRQTGESPERIAKRKEGRGWTKAGAAMRSCSTGGTVAKMKPATIWTPAYTAPAGLASVGIWNQQTGISWTAANPTGDIIKSASNIVMPGCGKSGGSTLPSGDPKKPANKLEAWKLKNEKFKRALNEKKKILDQVLGREPQKPMRIKFSLDQILDRLLYPEDFQRTLMSGSIQQRRRNRKHRKLGRILEPPMFSKRHKATKVNKVTPGSPSTVGTGDVHLCQSSKAPILPASQSNSQGPTMRNVRDGNRQDRPQVGASTRLKRPVTFLQVSSSKAPAKQSNPQATLQNVEHNHHHPSGASIPLKRPVTSLQALRKMGVLAKPNNTDLSVGQESSQRKWPAIAPRPIFDQSLKQCFPVAGCSPPVPPPVSSESGSQAILLRHLERRKKIEVRSCSKAQNIPTTAIPSSDQCKFSTECKEWRGQLRQRQTEPQSGFGHLGETRSVGGFELRRHSGVQSGFESFSLKETSIGFG